MKQRGFEVISAYLDQEISLPVRKTAESAGYDIEAAKDCVLLSHQVTVIPTGLKAYMQPDEYLGVHIRSGLSIRQGVSMINGQGIIDADYYNNEENEGHIMLALINHSDNTVQITKGMRVAQGIFYRYRVVDGDAVGAGQKRQGGMGSTGV